MKPPHRSGCFSELLLLAVAAFVFGAAGTALSLLLNAMTKHLLAR